MAMLAGSPGFGILKPLINMHTNTACVHIYSEWYKYINKLS